MPAAELLTGASFWDDYRDELTAVVTFVLAFVLAEVVDQLIVRREKRLTDESGRHLSPVATTRLRLIRRLIFAAIIVIGLALALSQFASIKRTATGVLASSAVLGLIVGFAARQTLANGIAGVLLAITQPIRIGDLVTFEGTTGEVEDIRLTYTYIRSGDGTRLIVPNERLASSPIENHTIVDRGVEVEVSLWLPPDADADRALGLLADEPEVEVEVAEVDKEGIRLTAKTWVEHPERRGAKAAEIRANALRRLQGERLSSGTAP